MTQKQLAERIGVSNSRVSNWEQGLNRPDADILAAVCVALDAFNLSSFLCGARNISFDMVVRTMKETGIHISDQYRETSEGGLARLYNRRMV